MEGFYLTAQDISDVRDEYALITEIEYELERLTVIFMLEYDFIHKSLDSDGMQQFNDMRNDLRSENDEGEIILRYSEITEELVKARTKLLSDYMSGLTHAEEAIKSKYYTHLQSRKDITKLPKINAETFEQLMSYDPALMAEHINRLNSNILIRLLHPSVLREKCLEFISLKNKAGELYKTALSKLKNVLSECTERASAMLIKIYHHEMQKNIPPEILEKFVNSMYTRMVMDAQSFIPSETEPLNVTVGKVYFDFQVSNDFAKDFLTQKYGFIMSEEGFVFPYTLAIDENLALLYKYDNESADKAKSDIQSICMNIFLASPPNKVRFYFIDPLKSGQTFEIFQHFEDSSTSGFNVVAGGVQTEQDSIEAQLQVLVDRIKTMHLSTFKGEYSNIREYNAKNTRNPQSYSIVGIMDFPAGFSAKATELLRRIVATGKECGIYVVIMSGNTQASSIQKYNTTDIESMCSVYISHGDFYLEEENEDDNDDSDNETSISYVIDDPIDIQEIVKLAPIMKKAIRDAGNAVIPYSEVAPPESEYLKSDTMDGLSIPIGINSANEIQHLRLGMLGSQSIHALICGQIGSGKSRLLHAIITGALLKYPQEELKIYLIDFKSGTEFKIYADYNLPAISVLALESEQEFGLSVLRSLKEEADRRAQIFNSLTKSDIVWHNTDAKSIETYGKLPRILVVIDEFHVLFGGNSNIASEASMLMDGLLRLERSYGFHVVLCSQSIRGMSGISEAAFAQIAVRIALKCPKEDADIVLGKGSDAIAQIEENDAGSAIYVPAISSSKADKFRVALLTPEEHAEKLKKLDEIYAAKHQISSARILVSEVSDDRNSVFQRYFADGVLNVQDRVIHIGEALRVKSNLEIKFTPSKDSNMLLIGKDIQKAQNMLFFATLDLVLQRVKQAKEGRPQINIHVVNYCDGAELYMNDKLQFLGCNAPQVNYYNGENAESGIEEIYRRLTEKKDGSPDEWLILSNLTLGEELSGRSMFQSQQRAADMFSKILELGSEKGVFSIIWCDDPEIYRRKFSSTFEYFNKRIIFNVSAKDAEELADIIGDDSINRNNAYLFQRGKGKEKFRPYSTPMDRWLSFLCAERLNSEGTGGNISHE